ncbi:hypothetical protein [Lactococcus lactis]
MSEKYCVKCGKELLENQFFQDQGDYFCIECAEEEFN